MVCADIVDHFYATLDPLGLKAQIVVADRALCVAYDAEIKRLLAQRHQAGHPLDECQVVMSVQSKDPLEWQAYRLTDTAEEDLLDRFRASGDALSSSSSPPSWALGSTLPSRASCTWTSR